MLTLQIPQDGVIAEAWNGCMKGVIQKRVDQVVMYVGEANVQLCYNSQSDFVGAKQTHDRASLYSGKYRRCSSNVVHYVHGGRHEGY